MTVKAIATVTRINGDTSTPATPYVAYLNDLMTIVGGSIADLGTTTPVTLPAPSENVTTFNDAIIQAVIDRVFAATGVTIEPREVLISGLLERG